MVWIYLSVNNEYIMRLLFVIFGRYPSPDASSKRISNYISALHVEKIQVDVLPLAFSKRSNISLFILEFFIPFLVFFRVLVKAHHYASVFVYGFGWISKLLIILACRLKRKPVAIELNEKPFSISGGSRRDIILKYFAPINEHCLKRIVFPLIDGYLVISNKLYEYVSKYKKSNAIVCKIPILVDYNYYQKEISKPDCSVPYILNSARMNDHKDGIINVFKAFSILVNQEGMDLNFYLTSSIAPKDIRNQIEDIILENKLKTKVKFLGDLDENTLLSYQKHCSMLVLNKVDSVQNRYNFATKLGEYMALGIPIITSQIGEVKFYLSDEVSCLYIDPQKPNDLAAAMIRIFEDENLAYGLGQEGKRIAENEFDYKKQSKRLSEFFINLLKITTK